MPTSAPRCVSFTQWPNLPGSLLAEGGHFGGIMLAIWGGSYLTHSAASGCHSEPLNRLFCESDHGFSDWYAHSAAM